MADDGVANFLGNAIGNFFHKRSVFWRGFFTSLKSGR